MSFRKGHCEKRCPTLLLISPKKPETSSSGPRNRDPARSTTRHTTMQATKAWVICAASLYFTSLDTKSLIYIQMQSFDLYACAHGVLARDSGGTVFARKYKSIWPCLSQDFASDYWMHQQATQKRASLALCWVCVHFVNIRRALPTSCMCTRQSLSCSLLLKEKHQTMLNRMCKNAGSRGFCLFFCECIYGEYISFHHAANDENRIGSGSHIVGAWYKKCKLCVGGCSGRLMSFLGRPWSREHEKGRKPTAGPHFLRTHRPAL